DVAARKHWHHRLAIALERAGGDDLEALAVHWRGAGDAPRAAMYAVAAADQAMRSLAFEHAVRLYQLAIALGPAPADRALRAKLAEALTNAGRGFEAAGARLGLA